jgi:hypothetical protein
VQQLKVTVDVKKKGAGEKDAVGKAATESERKMEAAK